MIIVRINGGIGNQMFQYAAGKALSLKHNTELLLDLSYYSIKNNNDTPRSYMLNNLNVTASIADQEILSDLALSKNVLLRNLKKIACRVGLSKRHMRWAKEKTTDFDRQILNCGKNTYLIGYWQSEKYFKNYPEIICNEFKINNPPNTQNRELLEKINNCNSVAIHIRRGDYYSNAQVNSVHGTFDLSYYNTCIKKIKTVQNDVHFFMFSDEPDWVMKNFSIDYEFTIVSHNSPNEVHEDLRLMAACRHTIIANSSLSWWAAWLNNNKDKMVFAPANWYKTKKVKPEDRFPSKWIII